MVLPGHIAAGDLTTYTVLAVTSYALTPDQHLLLLLAGTALGDAPDIDILYYFLKRKAVGPSGLSKHRTYITHTPLLWLLLGLIIFFCSTNDFGRTLGLLVWLCPWSHLLCDSISTGVMWLWPFSKKQYALYSEKISIFSNWRGLFRHYITTPLAWVEISLTFLGFSVFIHTLLSH